MSAYNLHIKRLKERYLLRRIGEILCLALGTALLVFAITYGLQGGGLPTVLISLLIGSGVFIARYLQLELHQLQERDITTYMNRQFGDLEDSTDLLVADPEALSPLQQVQRRRLITAFETAVTKVQWPAQWRLSLTVLGIGLLALLLVRQFDPAGGYFSALGTGALTDTLTTVAEVLPAELDDYRITVDPPAYTGLRTRNSTDFNLQVPEASKVSWALTFTGTPEQVMMVFSTGDSVLINPQGEDYVLSRSISQSGYYSINWRDGEGLKSTDFYKLEIIEDQIPRVAITNQEQFVEFPWQEAIEVKVNASISDDYGLTEAYVIATVSKGSGESVKFREERLAFSRPAKVTGKQANVRLDINTGQLGMEPGDELYYYVEAWDNHRPQRQSNRTETYFIQLQDTSTQMISFEGGLGVDLMPEYFRSQRQIIIDSEKLLTEKSSIRKKEFDDRSNNLAHDQKVLRLRYGQFLGEEFESGIAENTAPEEDAAPTSDEEVLEKYGHAHDSDNEHNLVPEAEHDHDHDHQHGHDENPNPEERDESPLEAFVHAHDNMEEATFFIQSVKAKLRAALSMMWDAELHLRMSDPAQSLPYQYKILKLLKEISQDSRIYVHRTGFDAPPLKEEKRLSGDLDEIKSSRDSYQKSSAAPYPAVEKALPVVEDLLNEIPGQLSTLQREYLLAAGNELAGAAIEQPDVFLSYLGELRALLDGEMSVDKLQAVRRAFWKLLPPVTRAAGGRKNTAHPLQDAFIEQLNAQRYR